jgi:hypothetical protein
MATWIICNACKVILVTLREEATDNWDIHRLLTVNNTTLKYSDLVYRHYIISLRQWHK